VQSTVATKNNFFTSHFLRSIRRFLPDHFFTTRGVRRALDSASGGTRARRRRAEYAVQANL
jgi:hypothetical protein